MILIRNGIELFDIMGAPYILCLHDNMLCCESGDNRILIYSGTNACECKFVSLCSSSEVYKILVRSNVRFKSVIHFHSFIRSFIYNKYLF